MTAIYTAFAFPLLSLAFKDTRTARDLGDRLLWGFVLWGSAAVFDAIYTARSIMIALRENTSYAVDVAHDPLFAVRVVVGTMLIALVGAATVIVLRGWRWARCLSAARAGRVLRVVAAQTWESPVEGIPWLALRDFSNDAVLVMQPDNVGIAFREAPSPAIAVTRVPRDIEGAARAVRWRAVIALMLASFSVGGVWLWLT